MLALPNVIEGGRGNYDRARRIERNRGSDISEVGRLAINACEACPLKLDCELYGKLGGGCSK